MLTSASILNYTAQQQLSTSWTYQWFANLAIEEQKDTLTLLEFMVQQSHPTPAMVEQAIVAQPAKPFTTPLAVLKAHPLPVALNKISSLPTPEYRNAFTILLAIFSLADTHRRIHQCQGHCHHDWHNLASLSTHAVE